MTANSRSTSRRTFLAQTAAGAALAGYGAEGLGLVNLPRVSAQEAAAQPRAMFRPEIEPLVELLEETPRERLLETVAMRIQAGLGYREVLAALLLAGVRNVQPRPSVGFKFHAVLAVNSAHLASLAGPDSDRWLPIFWGLDTFKSAQAQDVKEGNWTLGPVDESAVPAASKARAAFVAAMENWDVPAADAAIAGLARTGGLDDTFELFYRYGARDFRSIGHKAIYVAGARRLLEVIGREHAEPVLRSLAYALLMHEGDNPAKRDGEPDRDGRKNSERVKQLKTVDAKPSPEATKELLAALRTASPADASRLVTEQLTAGVAPQSLWDALFACSSELLMRQPGIVGLHTLTTTNAVHYAWQTAADPELRNWLLLQNAAFLPHFRTAMHDRGKVSEDKIDALEGATPTAQGVEGVREIFSDMGRDRMLAARKLLGYLQQPADGAEPPGAGASARAAQVMHAARSLVFAKGRDSHDYKFSAAVLEDYAAVSPPWRERLLAAGAFQFVAATAADNPLAARTRQAFA